MNLISGCVRFFICNLCLTFVGACKNTGHVGSKQQRKVKAGLQFVFLDKLNMYMFSQTG